MSLKNNWKTRDKIAWDYLKTTLQVSWRVIIISISQNIVETHQEGERKELAPSQ